MLDQLLLSLKEVCEVLLPIVVVVVLVYLALFLRKLIILLTHTVTLIDDINDKVSRLDHPVETINEICYTIDGVHHASVEGANNFIDYVSHNFQSIIGWFKEVINSRKNNVDVEFENESDSEMQAKANPATDTQGEVKETSQTVTTNSEGE